MKLKQIYEARLIPATVLEQAIDEVEAELQELSHQVSLNEEHSMGDELAAKLVKAQEKLAAAKKGLGIVNKLSAGDSKVKHAKRVMANVNRLRAEVQRLKKMLASHKED